MNTINHLLKFSSVNRLPVLHQSEAAECGLVCLLMIASFYGYKIDVSIAREKFNVSLKGLTLTALVNMAEKMELQARPLRVEIEALNSFRGPIILHWNLSHFVVLKKIHKNGVVIHDPAKGKINMTLAEFSKHFTGVVLELTPSNNFKMTKEIKPIKLTDFWARIHGLKRNLVQVFILSAILQIFVIAGPLMQQLVVDDAITKQDSNLLFVLAMGFLLIGLFQTVVTYIRSQVMLYLSNTLSFQMTANLFRHLIRLPLSYFEKRNIGDITTRFGSVGPIQTFISSGVIAIMLDGIMAMITLAMAMAYSVKLTLVMILFMCVNFAMQIFIFPYQKRCSEKVIEMSSKEQSVFLENIQTATTIKIFGQETIRENIWLNRKADNLNASIELANFNINYGTVNSLFSIVQTAFIMYLSASYVISGSFTLGMLFAYQSYSGQFSSKISAIFSQYMSYRMLDLHLQRLADIVHEKPEIDGYKNHTMEFGADGLQGNISLIDVRFRYGDCEPWVLDGVNLSISSGEMIAIKGLSGEGKSTLLKIMLGLLKPTEGKVIIDGIELATLNPTAYRNSIGVVMQDDKLLSGSISDNISFYDPDVDLTKVDNCAKLACLDGDIKKNPMGYNTLVGEMGSTLSGGQKQRLFLARALYRNPKILFLDEGTANLDSETENKIAETTKSMDITRIVIAHRPALIVISDRVFVLQNGKIFEESVEVPIGAIA